MNVSERRERERDGHRGVADVVVEYVSGVFSIAPISLWFWAAYHLGDAKGQLMCRSNVGQAIKYECAVWVEHVVINKWEVCLCLKRAHRRFEVSATGVCGLEALQIAAFAFYGNVWARLIGQGAKIVFLAYIELMKQYICIGNLLKVGLRWIKANLCAQI